MKDLALYCVAFHGDDRVAFLATGFDAMLELVRSEVFGEEMDTSNEGEWVSLRDEIKDVDAWTSYRDETESRFRYSTEIGDDCLLVIYRIWDAGRERAAAGEANLRDPCQD